MAVDIERALALTLPTFTVDVERGRLRLFARVIGETDPIYTDVEAARAAGHPDLPVPPTFFFSLILEAPSPFGYFDELDIDLRRVLHGEQAFEYVAMAYAGDTVEISERVVDVTVKRGGGLEFVTKETEFRRGTELLAKATNVAVVRNPEVTA
ncbi:MaoC family dehydratase N-terminal domain-containing protein [Nocardia sp. NPDC051833]|uniref:MaoC family dehydratase N-terminal domain-containing protein n=1 Tax=Nocardia sp. NPDC051833 TaxID=3155674 RepID=UPI00341DC1FC